MSIRVKKSEQEAAQMQERFTALQNDPNAPVAHILLAGKYLGVHGNMDFTQCLDIVKVNDNVVDSVKRVCVKHGFRCPAIQNKFGSDLIIL